jgi:endo-alpha-1,4-polygalactosaminidase (GH114 family)
MVFRWGWHTGRAVLPALPPPLDHVRTWAFAIGTGQRAHRHPARRLAGYDLVVVDGQEATRRQVRALRRGGRLVLAYLDVGTIEPGRPWYRRARPYRLDRWSRWGEWYADVDRRGYRRLIARQVAPAMLHKGFDGLFLDNTDAIEVHPRQAPGMHRLVRRLSRRVHRGGRLLFAQNGEESIGPTLRYYDGWNREDVTSTWAPGRHRYVRTPRRDRRAAAAALRRMRRHGLLTLSTDYTRARDARAREAATRTACAAGALPYVADIELRRLEPPQPCPPT